MLLSRFEQFLWNITVNRRTIRTNAYWVQLEIPDTSQSQIRPGRPWVTGYMYLIFTNKPSPDSHIKTGGGGGGTTRKQ